MEQSVRPNAVITARVFRARQEKPRFIPTRLWRYAQARRWPGTGRWENRGVIASTEKGTVTIEQ